MFDECQVLTQLLFYSHVQETAKHKASCTDTHAHTHQLSLSLPHTQSSPRRHTATQPWVTKASDTSLPLHVSCGRPHDISKQVPHHTKERASQYSTKRGTHENDGGDISGVSSGGGGRGGGVGGGVPGANTWFAERLEYFSGMAGGAGGTSTSHVMARLPSLTPLPSPRPSSRPAPPPSPRSCRTQSLADSMTHKSRFENHGVYVSSQWAPVTYGQVPAEGGKVGSHASVVTLTPRCTPGGRGGGERDASEKYGRPRSESIGKTRTSGKDSKVHIGMLL